MLSLLSYYREPVLKIFFVVHKSNVIKRPGSRYNVYKRPLFSFFFLTEVQNGISQNRFLLLDQVSRCFRLRSVRICEVWGICRMTRCLFSLTHQTTSLSIIPQKIINALFLILESCFQLAHFSTGFTKTTCRGNSVRIIPERFGNYLGLPNHVIRFSK